MNMHENPTFIKDELWDFEDTLRENLLRFTRRAFKVLPEIKNPHILDIGCGSGVPTMELVRLSGGEVTAIDINQPQLDRLANKIKELGLSSRIKVVNRSMFDMGLAEGSFDIIWTEGAIAVMGFEMGIKEWRRFIKSGGFLVVHDDLGNLEEKLEQISRYGYKLIDYFILNEDIWWNEYYALLEKKLKEIRQKNPDDQKLDELLDCDQGQIDGFIKHPDRYRSVFFIMKKDNSMSIHTC